MAVPVRSIRLEQYHSSVLNSETFDVGEVFYDTDLQTLRIMDSVTPGGHQLLRADLSNLSGSVTTSLAGTVKNGQANHFGYYASAGVAISDAGPNITWNGTTLSVTGVISVNGSNVLTLNGLSAGPGITYNSNTGTITNGGVLSITAGTGLSVTDVQGNVVITNTGVTSIIAGSNISLSANSGQVVISASGTGGGSTNAFSVIEVSGQSTLTASSPTSALTFVAGSGVTLTTSSATNSITISATSGSGSTNGTVSQGTANRLAYYASTGTTVQDSGANLTWNGSILSVTGTVSATTFSGSGSALTNIPNTALTNSSITVAAGTGLSGGGIVSLGGTITLNNTGVLNVLAGTGTSVSSVAGAVTITNTGVTSIIAGTGIAISGSTGAVTISSTSTGSGGLGIQSRSTVSITTGSLAAGSSVQATVTGYKGYALYSIQTSAAAWVTVYTSQSAYNNDVNRSITTDPTPGSGVVAESITTTGTITYFTPAVIGFSAESTPNTNIQLKIYNNGTTATAITVTLTLLQLEV